MHEHFRWRLANDFAPVLEELWRARPAEIIKDDRMKFVARYEVRGKIFYVKRYRHAAFPLRPLKFLCKPSQAAEEWRIAQECDARGVPAVRHVALGERWSARGLLESVLITEGFAGVPLEAKHKPFFAAVLELVRTMARAGITHRDFHPANLLVNEQTGELRLVDLYGAQTTSHGALNIELRLLAQLRVSLPLQVSQAATQAARVLRKQLLAQRARRCLKSNRDFARHKFGKLRWQVRRETLSEPVRAALQEPDAFLRRGRLLKDGRSSTVGAADGLVLKRHNFRKLLNPLKDFIRGSRGRRDFLKGYHLELCGIPTARVIATADIRVLGIPMRSYTLMWEIPGAVDASRASDAQIPELANVLAKLHDEGFTHRDLKETNLLFDAHGKAHLIDLDGLKFVFDLPHGEAAANLQRLARGLAGQLTRGRIVRFMLCYCRARHLSPRELFPSPLATTNP